MQSIPYLEVLDLSRNNIATVSDKTFSSSQYLRYLDLSVNVLRAVRFEIKFNSILKLLHVGVSIIQLLC